MTDNYVESTYASEQLAREAVARLAAEYEESGTYELRDGSWLVWYDRQTAREPND